MYTVQTQNSYCINLLLQINPAILHWTANFHFKYWIIVTQTRRHDLGELYSYLSSRIANATSSAHFRKGGRNVQYPAMYPNQLPPSIDSRVTLSMLPGWWWVGIMMGISPEQHALWEEHLPYLGSLYGTYVDFRSRVLLWTQTEGKNGGGLGTRLAHTHICVVRFWWKRLTL